MADFEATARALLPLLSNLPSGPPQHRSNTTFPIMDEPFYELLDPSPIDPSDGAQDRVVSVGVAAQPGEIEAGRRAVQEVGLDILAFYKSFRFIDRPPLRGKWGIFIIDQGIATVAAAFRAADPRLPRHEAEWLALQTLYEHERYHFWIDAWTLSMEAAAAGEKYKRYEYYLAHREAVALSPGDYEESLANHYAFRRLGRIKLSTGSGPAQVLRKFFETCPEPYSIFDLDTQTRLKFEGRLAGGLMSGVSGPTCALTSADPDVTGSGQTLAQMLRPDVRAYPLNEHFACPVYAVHDPGFVSRVTPFQGPDLKEMRRFVQDYLAGKPTRKTDHQFYGIDNGEEIKFPNPHDKDVRGYEFKNIIRKSGMHNIDFQRERVRTRHWKKACPRPEPKPPLQ